MFFIFSAQIVVLGTYYCTILYIQSKSIYRVSRSKESCIPTKGPSMRVVAFCEDCNNRALKCSYKANPSGQRHLCWVFSQCYGLHNHQTTNHSFSILYQQINMSFYFYVCNNMFNYWRNKDGFGGEGKREWKRDHIFESLINKN